MEMLQQQDDLSLPYQQELSGSVAAVTDCLGRGGRRYLPLWRPRSFGRLPVGHREAQPGNVFRFAVVVGQREALIQNSSGCVDQTK